MKGVQWTISGLCSYRCFAPVHIKSTILYCVFYCLFERDETSKKHDAVRLDEEWLKKLIHNNAKSAGTMGDSPRLKYLTKPSKMRIFFFQKESECREGFFLHFKQQKECDYIEWQCHRYQT